MRAISLPGFEYLDCMGFEYPQLVLAITYYSKEAFTDSKLEFNDNYAWVNIVHQSAGHRCNQTYMTGLILPIKYEYLNSIKSINSKWLDSDAGAFESSILDDILSYRNDLITLLKEDCNHSFRDFEEAFYPIDIGKDTLVNLTSLSIDIDNLLLGGEFTLHLFAHWNLYILGDNCD